MARNAARYQVSPIADEQCNGIKGTVIILTDNLNIARWHAAHNSCGFGAGIFDRQSGKLDVGYGFGVPCPDFTSEDEDEHEGV